MSYALAALIGVIAGSLIGLAHDAIKSALKRRKVRRDWTLID